MTPPARGTALVTGGTRGIGLGIAERLARDGWDLALCGMRADADVAGILAQVRGHGGRVEYFRADMSDSAMFCLPARRN